MLLILLSVYFPKETSFTFVLGTPSSGKSDAIVTNFTHTHTRVRARLPTAMLFFAVTSVTGGTNLGGKTFYFLDNEEEKQSHFRGIILCMFGT